MTIRTIINSNDPPFIWLDVVNPTKEELANIARQYGLHSTSVEDSLEPEHLPKYETDRSGHSSSSCGPSMRRPRVIAPRFRR